MSTVIRGRIPEHATLRYQEESVDDVQIPYDITFKLVGYESVQIEKQIKAIREAIKKKKTTKFWTLSEKGGGSAPQPNFSSMKSMDMCIEGGGVGAPRPN